MTSFVARSLRDVARGQRVHALLLSKSPDLICKNIMCEHVGASCACKLSLVLERVPELREMDLSHNHLRLLPASTFALTQLTHLDLSHNRLDTISTEMGQLKQLQVLDLAHNQLRSLEPSLLASLPQLKEVRVTGNPLTEDAIDALRQHADQVKIIE